MYFIIKCKYKYVFFFSLKGGEKKRHLKSCGITSGEGGSCNKAV